LRTLSVIVPKSCIVEEYSFWGLPVSIFEVQFWAPGFHSCCDNWYFT